MPYRQLADAGANSTIPGILGAANTTVTLQSASGFPGVVQGGQLSVTILDTGNPAYNAAAPLATPYEYQQVNGISGNVLTFGPGGGAAARNSYAGTTPKTFFAGATIAQTILAEDVVASAPWKFDEQLLAAPASPIRIPVSGSFPASYLGVSFRHIRIQGQARGDTAGNPVDVAVTVNGDTGTNYAWIQLYSNNTTTVGNFTTGVANIPLLHIPAAGAAAGQAGSFVLDIENAFGTTFAKNFTARSLSIEQFATANAWEIFRGGVWNNAAAITSLSLAPAPGNFIAASIFTTYLIP